MIIKVNDDYQIRSDSACWIVQKKGSIRKKTKKRDWQNIGYYADFPAAIQGLSELRVRIISDEAIVSEIKAAIWAITEEAKKAILVFTDG